MDSDVLKNTNDRLDASFKLYNSKKSMPRSIDQIIEEITQLHEKGNLINFNQFKDEICSILIDSPNASTLGKLFRFCNFSLLVMVIKFFLIKKKIINFV